LVVLMVAVLSEPEPELEQGLLVYYRSFHSPF
jgi:hypothetical protein